MRKIYAGKSKSGVEEVTEVGQIPFALIQAQTILLDSFKRASTLELMAAYDHLDAVLKFIAKGDCDLGALTLTDAQKAVIAEAAHD